VEARTIAAARMPDCLAPQVADAANGGIAEKENEAR